MAQSCTDHTQKHTLAKECKRNPNLYIKMCPTHNPQQSSSKIPVFPAPIFLQPFAAETLLAHTKIIHGSVATFSTQVPLSSELIKSLLLVLISLPLYHYLNLPQQGDSGTNL